MITFLNSFDPQTQFDKLQTESDKSKDSENQFLDLLTSAALVTPATLQPVQIVSEKSAQPNVAAESLEDLVQTAPADAPAANLIAVPRDFLAEQFMFGAQNSKELETSNDSEKQLPNLQIISSAVSPPTGQPQENVYKTSDPSGDALVDKELNLELTSAESETPNQNPTVQANYFDQSAKLTLISEPSQETSQLQSLLQTVDKTLFTNTNKANYTVDETRNSLPDARLVNLEIPLPQPASNAVFEVAWPENKLETSSIENQSLSLESESDVVSAMKIVSVANVFSKINITSTKASIENAKKSFAEKYDLSAAVENDFEKNNSFENRRLMPVAEADPSSFVLKAGKGLVITPEIQSFFVHASSPQKSVLNEPGFFANSNSTNYSLDAIELKNKKIIPLASIENLNLDKLKIGSDNVNNDTSFNLEIVSNNFEVEKQISGPLLSLREKLNIDNRSQAIKIKLNPEELGEVEIRLENSRSGKLSAHIITETNAAKQVLTESLSRLETALQNSGWQIEQLEVSFGQSSGHSEHQQQQSQSEAKRSFELLQFEKLTEPTNAKSKIDSLKILSVRA